MSAPRRACIESIEPRTLLASTASLVKDVVAGATSGVTYSADQYAALGNTLLFRRPDSLWKTDGTAAGTVLVKKFRDTGDAFVADFEVGNGVAYFTADDGSGLDIWQSNGVSTTRLTTFFGAATPVFLRVVNGKLVFFTVNTGTPQIWHISGGVESPMADVEQVQVISQVGNTLYFSAEQAGETNVGLWNTDGDTATFVKDFAFGSSNGINAPWSGGYNGQLFFSASTPGAFSEPWKSNGTGGGTISLADINPTSSSFPTNFAVSGGVLYFVADPGAGPQIYKTTGTGATKVTNLHGGTIANLTDFKGTLYFTYASAGASNSLLYKLAGGTTATPIGSAVSPFFLTPVGPTLFFRGTDSNSVQRLYETDGTTITQVGGDAGTDPANLVNFNGKLFYTASDAAHGIEPHVAAPQVISVGLRANGKSSATVNEGETVQFNTVLTGIGRDQVRKYYYFFEDVLAAPATAGAKLAAVATGSAAVAAGPKPTHVYLDDPVGALDIYDVRVKFVFKDGTARNARAQVGVNNKPPEIVAKLVSQDQPALIGKINPPADRWAMWHPLDAYISVEDVTPEDLKVVTVNWGDGRPIEVHPAGDGSLRLSHTFTSASPADGFEIRIAAKDKDGAESKPRKFQLVVRDSVRLSRSLDVDLIGGTASNDQLTIVTLPPGPGTLDRPVTDIRLNGKLIKTFLLDPPEVVIVHLGSGNDTAELDSRLEVFTIYGDGGSDTLNGKPIK